MTMQSAVIKGLMLSLLVLLIFGGVEAYNNKDKILMLLGDYEEECYEYRIDYWTETYCKSDYGYSDWKNDNEERPCCSNSFYTTTLEDGTKEEMYWCLSYPYEKTFWNVTDECIKYHLVRNVND